MRSLLNFRQLDRFPLHNDLVFLLSCGRNPAHLDGVMVANISNPSFSGGLNIAVKVPLHLYPATIAFYRDTLGLPLVEEEPEGCIFQFGPMRLWVDKAPQLSKTDVWLELETSDTEAAARYLKNHGVARRDEIEALPEDFDGFFISDPAGTVHIVVGDTNY